MLCSCAVGGKFVFLGYGSETEKKPHHTNGECLTLWKQHAVHKLVHLSIPQHEFNDSWID